MKISFSWDDGAPQDEKLFALHERYRLPGIFFVPNENREGFPVISARTMRAAASEQISFGAHTFSHCRLARLPVDRIDEELRANQEYLQDVLGTEIRHFCLPGGEYDQRVLERAFRRFQTVRTADTMNFAPGGALIKPTFHVCPRGARSLLANGLRHRSYWAVGGVLKARGRLSDFEIMRMLLAQAARRKAQTEVLIWGHSWEIEKLDLWEPLEELFRLISGEYRDDSVRYDDFTARKQR